MRSAPRRQAALDDAYTRHPERFPNGPPAVRRPPTSVAINPLSIDATTPASIPALTLDAVDAPPRSRRPRRQRQSASTYALPS